MIPFSSRVEFKLGVTKLVRSEATCAYIRWYVCRLDAVSGSVLDFRKRSSKCDKVRETGVQESFVGVGTRRKVISTDRGSRADAVGGERVQLPISLLWCRSTRKL